LTHSIQKETGILEWQNSIGSNDGMMFPYRIDSSFNVWLGDNFLLYKLNANQGDQWVAFAYGDSGEYGYEIMRLKLVEEGSQFGVPTTYKQYHNYWSHPNPFNPNTKIKYQIPNEGLVTIKVYDILGKEITTLANEIKSPGEYTVTFDASSLSSGIYFCTMQAGGFITTNKLLMVK
jgi:hypothetical protein